MYKREHKSLRKRLEEAKKTAKEYIGISTSYKILLDKSIRLCGSCNGLPVTFTQVGYYKIICTSCRSISAPYEGWFTNQNDAIQFWNSMVDRGHNKQ